MLCFFWVIGSMKEAHPNRGKNHFGSVPIQITIVTQALNTRTHTNQTVVTTGSTKIVLQKWKNYLVCVVFDCLEASRILLGGGGDLAFQGLFTDRQLLDPCSKGHILDLKSIMNSQLEMASFFLLFHHYITTRP
jgi:hypothetical protein